MELDTDISKDIFDKRIEADISFDHDFGVIKPNFEFDFDGADTPTDYDPVCGSGLLPLTERLNEATEKVVAEYPNTLEMLGDA